MPIYALAITVLVLMVCYLIYKLHRASKEKIVVLVTHHNEGLWRSWEEKTSWKIFDSMVEAKAFIEMYSNEKATSGREYVMIRTAKVDKNLYE